MIMDVTVIHHFFVKVTSDITFITGEEKDTSKWGGRNVPVD